MKPAIIVYSKLKEETKEMLESAVDVHYFDDMDIRHYDQNPAFLEKLQEVQGLLGSGIQVDSSLLDKAPNLKIVSNISVGYNNFDIEEMTKRKVIATNTPGVLDETTADTIFGLLIATARRMPELDHVVKQGKWGEMRGEQLFGVDVHHKTIGIIGMGRIGQAIAKRARHGFSMNVLYYNRTRNVAAEEQYDAQYCNLDTLLQQSDFVCMMAPLTNETKEMIGRREFALMKNTAIFINGSRGETIDETALIEALENKTILAAGLDVYQQEPIPFDHPLLKFKQVVTLPHIGSATAQTRLDMAKLGAENVIAGVTGKKPPSVINEDVFL